MAEEIEIAMSKEDFVEVLRTPSIAKSSHEERLFLLCQLDIHEVEGVADWLMSRHVDCWNPRKLSKACPLATSALRYGPWTHEEVAAAMSGVVYKHCCDDQIDYPSTSFNMLADVVIPTVDDIQEEAKRKTMREKLVLLMRLNFSKNGNEYEEIVENIQRAFKRAISKQKKTLVAECYDTDDSAFLETCRPFVNSIAEYEDATSKLLMTSPFGKIHQGQASLAELLIPTLRVIEQNLDISKNHCWECEKLVGDGTLICPEIMICSRCKAARYCGKECQHKAWKEGHRKACRSLKHAYQNYLRNVKLVNQAHEDPQAHAVRYGMTVGSKHCDYTMVASLCDFPVSPAFGEANMAAFFENLGRVKAGKLWIYPELATNETVLLDGFDVAQESRSWEDREEDFWTLCECLAYDYSSDDIEDKSKSFAITVFLHSAANGRADKVKHISPQEFLAWYTCFRNHDDESFKADEMKHYVRTVGFKMLRLRHKEAKKPWGFSTEQILAMYQQYNEEMAAAALLEETKAEAEEE